MAVEYAYELRSLIEFTGLTSAWCDRTLRLLAVDDVSGVVEAEMSRLRKIAANRAGQGSDGGVSDWDEAAECKRVRDRAHHFFATQEVRPIFLESLVLGSWDAVVEQARESPLFISDDPTLFVAYHNRLKTSKTASRHLSDNAIHRLWIQRQLGLRLGTDASNIWRWEKFKTLPGGDKVLGAILIGLRCDFHLAKFPPRQRLIAMAVARTLAFIRDNRYGKQESRSVNRLPEPVDLAIVRFALRHHFTDDLLVSSQIPNQKNIKDLFVDTALALRMEYPKIALRPDSIKRSLSEWATAYALFLVGLASGWPDETVEEQFWGDIE